MDNGIAMKKVLANYVHRRKLATSLSHEGFMGEEGRENNYLGNFQFISLIVKKLCLKLEKAA